VSTLILASTSPRRAALLAEAGIAFEPLDPGIGDASEEELTARWRALGIAPGAVAKRLAVAKALAAAGKRDSGLVLAADTVVALDDRALGKPRDRADARAMIELLAGRTHQVTTGFALLDLATGRLEADSETSRVSFKKIDGATLEGFLASGTWAGKAGAYGVQDEAARPLVAAVEGSRSNVVGLPVERVRALLARVAVALLATCLLAGCPGNSGPTGAQPNPNNPGPVPITSFVPIPKIDVKPSEPDPNEPFVPGVDDGQPSHGLPEMTLTIGDKKVTVELATTPEERELGLMNRDSMPEDKGMLFVFSEHGRVVHNFWMKNTRLPLSIAYLLDDGTIRTLDDMDPLDMKTRHESGEPCRLALELNKGWFKIHGVRPGDKIQGITPELLATGE
jgi:septum formation protein